MLQLKCIMNDVLVSGEPRYDIQLPDFVDLPPPPLLEDDCDLEYFSALQ